MAAHQPNDPFLLAESDLTTLLTQTRSLLSSYTRIRQTTQSASGPSPELLSARADLTSSLEDLTSDLQDLVDAVRAVEGDPYRYGLDVAEVERRRKLVSEVGREVEGMRGMVGTGASNPTKVGGLPNPVLFEGGGDSDDEGNDAYNEFEESRQQEMLEEQDGQLEGVFQTVGNLRLQADEMGRELEEQGELLDDVDGLADRVGGKLQEGLKRVGWVVRKNEGESLFCGFRDGEEKNGCAFGVLMRVMLLTLSRNGEQLLHWHFNHRADHTPYSRLDSMTNCSLYSMRLMLAMHFEQHFDCHQS